MISILKRYAQKIGEGSLTYLLVYLGAGALTYLLRISFWILNVNFRNTNYNLTRFVGKKIGAVRVSDFGLSTVVRKKLKWQARVSWPIPLLTTKLDTMVSIDFDRNPNEPFWFVLWQHPQPYCSEAVLKRRSREEIWCNFYQNRTRGCWDNACQSFW